MPQYLLTHFSNYIGQQQLFDPTQKVLLAVSGGLDSVVMAHLFKAAGYNAGIAHCNFQLRAAESVRDENFVRELAAALDLPLHVIQFDTAAYAASQHMTIQVAARELRYKWLEEIRATGGYAVVATAHHMQDSVETALMNFAKGTGIAGLHGILPKQERIVRPLLFTLKDTLIAYAAMHNISHVEDSSNITDKYTRNFFRHHIIPPLTEAYPGAVKNMAGTIDRIREAEILYQQAMEKHRKRLLFQKDNTWMVPVLKLQKSVPLQTIAWELFRQFNCSPAQVKQVLQLLDSESGKLVETSTHRIIRNRAWILITPLVTAVAPLVVIDTPSGHITFPAGQLRIKALEHQPGNIPASPAIAWLDAAQISFPLILRKWKQGDYFYPLGLPKKKKLSRFLIDQKLSLPQKENVWVLESAKRIVWVVGMRIDDRFKITEKTRQVISLELDK
ncbi:tRNA lysidine(34) synthetase TilS [Chitinophaga nivalis]|uniref:tRNA(Ile)-lysidine synthase n=1 Tax=Chitinophaga nivalis TaxID=2991709 RepID=A0ABT3ILK3_9BACT|nr:tRNA lysidine(34) synthetase TilS [Chitinophaga nivalis]MCW3465467.1 tRNA lysidine(34) synthetase TilS [Chitinophaga nivalis]MCW3484842.1 tRNA lysidine(34) synthetase TilS [Chitinophaga nivalis]